MAYSALEINVRNFPNFYVWRLHLILFFYSSTSVRGFRSKIRVNGNRIWAESPKTASCSPWVSLMRSKRFLKLSMASFLIHIVFNNINLANDGIANCDNNHVSFRCSWKYHECLSLFLMWRSKLVKPHSAWISEYSQDQKSLSVSFSFEVGVGCDVSANHSKIEKEKSSARYNLNCNGVVSWIRNFWFLEFYFLKHLPNARA